jgi:ribonuclease BN (tRNA processing enzyme)
LPKVPDVLLHEAFYMPGIDRLVARVPNAMVLKQSILSHHTAAEDARRVAQAAGLKTLVLSDLVPSDDPAITDQMWIDAARKFPRGGDHWQGSAGDLDVASNAMNGMSHSDARQFSAGV